MKIEGTRAAVTGAATGIGRGIALALAEKGAAFVAVADLDLDAAERTATEVRARGAKAIAARVDVRHRAELEKFADLSWAQAAGIDRRSSAARSRTTPRRKPIWRSGASAPKRPAAWPSRVWKPALSSSSPTRMPSIWPSAVSGISAREASGAGRPARRATQHPI